MKNIGTYFEIPVDDFDRAIKFYSYVFKCDFSKDIIHGNEMAFFPYDKQGIGITGALCKGEIYKPSVSGSLIYLSTNDINETLDRALKMGGEVLFPITAIPDIGSVAEIKDCEGNRIALFQRIDQNP